MKIIRQIVAAVLVFAATLPAFGDGIYVPPFSPSIFSGDCTSTAAGVLTCLKTNGTNFGTGATATAPAAFPGYQAGVYIVGRVGNPAGNASTVLASNTLYAYPLVMDGSDTWTSLNIYVITAGTAANCRVGIFNSSGGLPSTLLLDAGVITVGLTGQKTTSAISQTLAVGIYYAVVVCDGIVTLAGIGTSQGPQDLSLAGFLGTTSMDAGTDDLQLSKSFTYGVLSGASPFGAVTRAAANIPLVTLKK